MYEAWSPSKSTAGGKGSTGVGTRVSDSQPRWGLDRQQSGFSLAPAQTPAPAPAPAQAAAPMFSAGNQGDYYKAPLAAPATYSPPTGDFKTPTTGPMIPSAPGFQALGKVAAFNSRNPFSGGEVYYNPGTNAYSVLRDGKYTPYTQGETQMKREIAEAAKFQAQAAQMRARFLAGLG